MIKIELTEEQLDDLKTILDYVCEITSENYLECLEEGVDEYSLSAHTYSMANNLRSLTWSKV
jgi:hypothetical protein